MKVLMLTTSFPRKPGGCSGVFVFELCRQLTYQGLDVNVLAPHEMGVKKNEVWDGVGIHRFQYFWPEKYEKLCYGSGVGESIKSPKTLLQLPFFFLFFCLHAFRLSLKADVIHCQWALSAIPGLITGALLGKPVVCTFHGAEVYTGGFRGIVKFVGEHVDFLTFNSTYTRDKTLEFIKPRQYKVIPPFSGDIREIRPGDPGDLRREYNLPLDSSIIFSLGRLVERKGFEYLVEAFKTIPEKNVYLIIGGSGPLQPRLKELVVDCGVGERVFLPGFIPSEKISMHFTGCDIFVLPAVIDSRGDTEGLGLVLVEAQAYGKPVVASNVGGIIDLIEDGVNGFLVEEKNTQELAEKTQLLLEDSVLRRQLGLKGRDMMLAKFIPEDIANQTFKVYHEVLR